MLRCRVAMQRLWYFTTASPNRGKNFRETDRAITSNCLLVGLRSGQINATINFVVIREHVQMGFVRSVFVNTPIPTFFGVPFAFFVAVQYGISASAILIFIVMLVSTGLGTTLGFHRLFAHRSFATTRSMEWTLMILGCMAGQNSPFYWVANHRNHHRYSDHEGDPHSPHIWAGRRIGFWTGIWHSYFGWLRVNGYEYDALAVKDLARRSDLAWIDRNWFKFFLAGLAIPALIGLVVGQTGYDALIGFLWGGVLRHFIALQVTFSVNSVCHLWGTRPYSTLDDSRNNFLLGVIAFGDGWHNNHHAFPHSARHGFHWWQPDFTWSVILLMERIGLVWDVKRPKLAQDSHELMSDENISSGNSSVDTVGGNPYCSTSGFSFPATQAARHSPLSPASRAATERTCS